MLLRREIKDIPWADRISIVDRRVQERAMKRQQGFQWKKFSKMQQNSDGHKEVSVAVGATVLFDMLCALIFLVSSVNLAQMTYETLKFDASFFVRAFLFFLPLILLTELAKHVKKLMSVLIWLTVFVAGLSFLLFFLSKETIRKRLILGFFNTASVFFRECNSYFGVNLICPGGDAKEAVFFWEFLLLSLSALLLLAAKVKQKNTILAVLPIVLFVIGLFVGKDPSATGVLLLFVGILLAKTKGFSSPDFRPSENKKRKQAGILFHFNWLFSAAAIVLICLVVSLAGRTFAETAVTEYAGEAKQLILSTANHVANRGIWKNLDIPGDIEHIAENIWGASDSNSLTLSNSAPEFKDIPYLKVTMKQLPNERLYLKGFYADTYDNGIWRRNSDVFEEKCLEKNMRPETMSEEIALLGISKVKANYHVTWLSNHYTGVDVRVFYYDADTVKAYLPYFSEAGTQELTAEGEGNYCKPSDEDELICTMWQFAGTYDTRLKSFKQKEKLAWEQWYEAYVTEQYLSVPDNLPNVKKVASELLETEPSKNRPGSTGSKNEERLAKAQLVANWMENNTSYRLNLPRLPFNEDPIEYFLGTTRAGYCMHYASAAVMILREMEVPARYASGYVVGRSSFKETKDGFTAVVLDNQAHAWAEIYLDGIGWVPVEVTAGYVTLTPTPTVAPTPTNTPTPTPTNTPTPMPTNTVAPSPASAEEESEYPIPSPAIPSGGAHTPAPIPTPTDTPAPTKVPAYPGDETGIGSPDNEAAEGEFADITLTPAVPMEKQTPLWTEFLKQNMLMLVLILGAVLLALSPATVVDKFFRLEKVYHKKLLWKMKKKSNAQAIKMVNRSIYRNLCFYGMIKPGCTDEEYEKALKANFSVLWKKDWDRYMELVKAAEFSLRDFTDEEVEFCYKILRDVIY